MYAIAALTKIIRSDARKEVKVPATQGRKAYSYFREGAEGEAGSSRRPSRKVVAGVGGAITAAGLAGLAAIAMRRSESNRRGLQSPAFVPPKIEGVQEAIAEKLSPQETRKIPVGRYLSLGVGGMIGLQVVREKTADIRAFSEFKKDREQLAKDGIPNELKKSYQHMNPELALSVAAAEARIKDNDFETVYAFDKEGKPLIIRGGSRAGFGYGLTDYAKLFPFGQRKNISVITHNHPLDATLSAQDFVLLEKQQKMGFNSLTEFRATSAKNMYSLRARKGEFLGEQGTKTRTSKVVYPSSRYFAGIEMNRQTSNELKMLKIATMKLDEEVLTKKRSEGLKGKELLESAIKEIDERGEERHQAILEAYKEMNRRKGTGETSGNAKGAKYESTPSRLIYTRIPRKGK